MPTKTDQIVRLKKAGNTPTMISKFLELSNEHVRQVLLRKKLVKPRMTQDQVDQLYQMAEKGMKTVDIAEIMDISISTAQWYLRKAGMARKTGSPNRSRKKSYKWDFPKKQSSI